MAGEIAREFGWDVEEYPADWSRGRIAGPLRNGQMLDTKPDYVVAIGYGRGTADCVNQARHRMIPVWWHYASVQRVS